MVGMVASITKKGQVTIPIEIRKALGLKPRDRVVFELHDKEVRIKLAPSGLLAGFGAVKPKEKPEDFKRMRKDIVEWVAEEAMKELENG